MPLLKLKTLLLEEKNLQVLLCILLKKILLLTLLNFTSKLVAHKSGLFMSGLLQVELLNQVLLMLLPLSLLLMLSQHPLKLLDMTLLSLIYLLNGPMLLFLQPTVHLLLLIMLTHISILSLTKPILLWLIVLLVMNISMNQLMKLLCKQ